MKNEKIKKANALLDAIGEIDDIYLSEALSYRRKRGIGSRVLVIAATLTLSLILLVSAVISSRFASGSESDEVPPYNAEQTSGLDSFMIGINDREAFAYVEEESELPYRDGNAYIVWQYSGENRYYISEELSYTEISYLKTQIGSGEEVGGNSPELECKVWILLGDGRVVSPYLKASTGNISNEIFDYEAEIDPNEGLVNKISAILS